MSGEDGKATSADGRVVLPKARPSLGTLLWQSLWDELAGPQAVVSANGWRWPAIVAIGLLAASGCGLAWLWLGVLATRDERRRSDPVQDPALLELVDVLCAELSCRRPIEVRQSADLATAATIGWRRPVLLLPSDWTTWTAEQRRAVLAHEIAHARSGDFLALLLGQLGLVLHFYHPLLHWLVSRLRLEQELAADAAAANLLGGRRDYLTAIAELALRQQDRPLSWPARSFLPTQTTFLRRIAMLRSSNQRFDRGRPAVRLAAVGAVLLCGLLVAGLRGPAEQQVLANDAANVPKEIASNTIVEGIGWNGVRVGATKAEFIKALGKADGDSTSNWLKWKKNHHIECTFYNSDKATEVRFNPGFQGALANGLKLGAPGGEVLKLYGEPEHVLDRRNGAKKYEYSQKGILFWTYQGKITQIVVFKPYNVSVGQIASEDTSSNNNFVAAQTPEAEFGDYWAKYQRWAAYHKGAVGVPKNSEKARQWLEQLVEGTYLAKFQPINGFHPKTPAELLAQFAKYSDLGSEPKGVGGASFFRTRAENGELIGSFITAYPDRMRKAIADNPSLKLISIEKLTPEMFVHYEASPQESLAVADENEMEFDTKEPPSAVDTLVAELKHDDGKPDGKWSLGGSGEMIQFSLPTEKGRITGVRIHGSRYGTLQPPAEDFMIYVLNEDRSEILFTETAPYRLFQRGKEKWVDVKFKKAREVPKNFWIVLDFKAHQTKGVYVSFDNSTGGKHSKNGLPGQNTDDTRSPGDWMIRVKLATDAPATTSK
ncbi:MAG: M56 family metallopeptidase [Planctomycetaceae bacterium]|nr:M56 family metallopeptidase [Planctomycetaceae bacterium]